MACRRLRHRRCGRTGAAKSALRLQRHKQQERQHHGELLKEKGVAALVLLYVHGTTRYIYNCQADKRKTLQQAVVTFGIWIKERQVLHIQEAHDALGTREVQHGNARKTARQDLRDPLKGQLRVDL